MKLLFADCFFFAGQSELVRDYMEHKNVTVTDIFLDHTATVATIARTVSPGVQVLVWDDMMRTAELDQLLQLSQLVTPVVWSYSSQLSFPAGMLDRYQTVWADSLMAGSAWRGATGSDMTVTTVSHHVDNHLAWMEVFRNVPSFSGIILTGWARYDHYATLCELLPVSLPSLKCCLTVVTGRNWSPETLEHVSRDLGLSQPLDMEPYKFQRGDSNDQPNYPGGIIYTMMMKYIRYIILKI